MIFLRAHRDRLIFLLDPNERRAFTRLLLCYPLIPPEHQRVSRKSAPKDQDHQALLDEALAEQREEHKRNIRDFVTDRARFRKVTEGYRLSLTPMQTEWLLKVLNDIRVGSWLHLGEPDDLDHKPPKDEELQQYYWIMNLAGFFQCVLLEALGGSDSAP